MRNLVGEIKQQKKSTLALKSGPTTIQLFSKRGNLTLIFKKKGGGSGSASGKKSQKILLPIRTGLHLNLRSEPSNNHLNALKSVYNLTLAHSPVASPFLCGRVEFRSTRPVWPVEILVALCCHLLKQMQYLKELPNINWLIVYSWWIKHTEYDREWCLK